MDTQETEVKEIDQPAAADANGKAQEGADLNISDLAALRSIIDVASQRGAFKAAELEAVGKMYNKLNSFIETVTKREQ
jgi:hypothetical protein